MHIAMMVAAAAIGAGAPPCSAHDVVLTTKPREGDGNDVSHVKTYLVLRNRSRRSCQIPGLPRIAFYDGAGHPVPAERQVPRWMHPGPVIRPVVIPAGGSVAAVLGWVSGPVGDHQRRIAVRRVGVAIRNISLRTELAARMSGDAGRPIAFTQSSMTVFPDLIQQ